MADRAMLVQQEGPGLEAKRWVVEKGVTSIGRWSGNEVVLPDREVSRKHAQVRHDGANYVLVDLGSKNGTRVNGIRVEGATRLVDGDEIVIAPRYRLLFVDSDATVPAVATSRGVRIDPASRTVWVAGERIEPPLAPNQFALLQLLASRPGRVFSRDEIADACYPEAEGGVTNQAIDGVVRRLRSRLTEADPDTDHIVALRGHGFRLQT